MAKAWYRRGSDGRVVVRGKGFVEGEDFFRRMTLPDDDDVEDVAREMVKELNQRFAMGDYGWLTEKRKRPTKRRRPKREPFGPWSDSWIESMKGQIGEHTWRSYKSAQRALKAQLGELRLDQMSTDHLLGLRKAWQQEGRKHRTINDRLGLLRMMFRDAKLSGVVASSPFDVPLPTRRTKRQRQQANSKRVTFQPFTPIELAAMLKVCRSPANAQDQLWFPPTEFLILTGLRFAEGAGCIWSDVSKTGGLITIRRAVPQYGEVTLDEPTKTGAVWPILISPGVKHLLGRQEAVSRVGRDDGWIFPNGEGNALNYANWYKRGWKRVLKLAKVAGREGDAQKALRRSYIISSLVCGRNPKLVAAELGHATARMVTENYDAFLDPARWPSEKERDQLRRIYQWSQLTPGGVITLERKESHA